MLAMMYRVSVSWWLLAAPAVAVAGLVLWLILRSGNRHA
jgi:hypothetical protein